MLSYDVEGRYFIIEGEVEVEKEGQRLGFLSPGSFFGEAPMIEAIRGKGNEFQRCASQPTLSLPCAPSEKYE
jgi:CRP-like cAMP-binding protein